MRKYTHLYISITVAFDSLQYVLHELTITIIQADSRMISTHAIVNHRSSSFVLSVGKNLRHVTADLEGMSDIVECFNKQTGNMSTKLLLELRTFFVSSFKKKFLDQREKKVKLEQAYMTMFETGIK